MAGFLRPGRFSGLREIWLRRVKEPAASILLHLIFDEIFTLVKIEMANISQQLVRGKPSVKI